MGHYRSESGYEAEDERRAKEAAKRRKALVKKIKDDIAKRGIEEVLADIVIDPQMYRIHNY